MDPTIQALLDEYPEHAVDVDGGRITYRVAGAGRPLVLLHGIGSGAGSWIRLFPCLEDRYCLVAWNAPGYGRSTPLAFDHPTAADYANALEQFLREIGLQRPVLVGHSLGALMAASYAARRLGTITGLVLASPARGHGHLTPDERQARLADRLETMEEYGPRGVAEQRTGKLLSAGADAVARDLVTWNMARLNPGGYGQAARMLSMGTLIDDVERIESPILVVCGSEDGITPPRDAEEVAQAAPASHYRLLEGAGHACYVEQPDAFARLIGDYLEENQ